MNSNWNGITSSNDIVLRSHTNDEFREHSKSFIFQTKMKSTIILAIIFALSMMIVESRPSSSRLSKAAASRPPSSSKESKPESNEIDNPDSCTTIKLPLRQNVLVCNEMTKKFPFGCFVMKFSFGLNTVVCFTPNKMEEKRGECVRVDWPSYHLDGSLCLSYTWAIPALF